MESEKKCKKYFSKATCYIIYYSRPSSVLVNEKRMKFDKIFGSFVYLCLYHPEILFSGVASFIQTV